MKRLFFLGAFLAIIFGALGGGVHASFEQNTILQMF